MHKIMLISCIIILVFLNPVYSSQNKYPDYYPELNNYYSDKTLGASIENGKTYFRIFAPRAKLVSLIIFEVYNSQNHKKYNMKMGTEGIWEYTISNELYGTYYGYKIDGPKENGEMFDNNIIIADPYSKAVVTQNDYHHSAKSIIIKNNYNWEGDTWLATPIQDLIIYEMHVRDMTIHPSSGVEAKGTYRGLVEKGKVGGFNYLKNLGINAVELLPCHDFSNIEIPYMDSSLTIVNTWNPYERNHWGYMTTYFFAPESYYASDYSLKRGEYCGIHGQQVREFKDMVKEFHKNGIAVIMDVVYNHVSQYDYNPFKYIDKKYYFRLDSNDNFLSKSGCGNDFMTERPMARKLILESIKYWMTEYHIDGFRFDLANLIDFDTCVEIIKQAKKINPNGYIIAEPWGDGYGPAEFSKIGWAAWNDKFRNAVKGQNPFNNLGYIFGQWEKENSPKTINRYVTGSLTTNGGQYQKMEHSINYLESHDDHTLGDFIRIGTHSIDENDEIKDVSKHTKLTPKQLKFNKLAALFLLTSQGAVMIHQGQEFARSKVTINPDGSLGKIDHNSYNKDNETNYINYTHKQLNSELFHYYKGLIEFRKKFPVFRKTSKENINFLPCENEFGFGFHIKDNNDEFIVLMNSNPNEEAIFKLPQGKWGIIVNENSAEFETYNIYDGEKISVSPITGIILKNY